MVTRPSLLALLVAVGLLSSLPARLAAQPMPESDVPPSLRPWIPWALEGSSHQCAARDGVMGNDANPIEGGGEPVCVWPGDLALVVTAEGGSFTLEVTSDHRTALALPGRGRHWPVDVRVDGRAAVVLALAEQPVVWVEPGAHRIEGRFVWTSAPDTLAVPDAIARITLSRDGTTANATRGTGGEVWLRGVASEVAGEEEVGLEVHRRIQDGSPLELSTRIVVRAAGRARELRLPSVLPPGVVPVEITADLPVRLLATGELSIQLRAGTFEISIRALAADPETVFRRPALPAPWPEQEVWVWSPDEAFRQVEVQGAAGIDPQRTSLPDAWRTSSAYLVDASTELSLHTVRRGEATPPPNLISVTREMWLDIDGRGFTARDQLGIDLHSTHRLELAAGDLGRVSLDGQDQLVTRGEGDRPGVELRDTRRTFTAEWRMARQGETLPAVNWSENASSSSTTLHVPPGWTLVHASGVDHAPGTWLDHWTLLGVFALLLISAAVGRVFGWPWAAAAFVGVGLAFHEADAPQWIWLVLAAMAGLHRALGARSIERVVRWAYVATAIVAVLAVVWFSAAQLRNALYPQLATPSGPEFWAGDALDLSLTRTAPMAPAAEESWGGAQGWASGGEGGSGARYGAASSDDAPSDSRSLSANSYWLDPNAVVQTGFGLPTWSWSSYQLYFDGPVSAGHEITVHLLPPWAFRIAALLRSVLLLALLGVMIVRRPVRPSAPPSEPGDATRSPEDSREPAVSASEPATDRASEGGSDRASEPATDRASEGASGASDGASDAAAPTAASAEGAPDATSTGASSSTARVAAALAVGATIALASLLPARVFAQEIPDQTTLDALRDRLTRPAACGDRCSEANHMQIHVAGDVLRIVLDVSAANVAAYPLPGPSDTWIPTTVSIDGAPTRSLTRLDNGFLHVRVPVGAHQIVLEGPVTGRDAVTLAFGRAPRALDVDVEGWEASGHTSDDRVSESIQLRRTLESQGTETEARSDLPAWLEVQRTLDIGVRWTVQTTVTRRSPANAPTVARVQLLPGERVTDSGVTVEGGQVLVTLGQQDTQTSWTSVIDPSDSLVLTAPSDGARNEVWVLTCSPLWHCATPTAEAGGLSPTTQGPPGVWQPMFHPWPGESLTVSFARPEAAEGQSLTVDSARLDVTPGVRLTSSSLTVSVRSSVSAPFEIELPAGANVQSLTVDGQSRPLQREGDRISVALQPGHHDLVLSWQADTGWTTVLETPRVTLGSAAVNVELHVILSSDRWVLWLGGPSWGPAVLFWPYLVLTIAIAFALSRRKDVPLQAHHWLLLLVGLTQVPAAAAVIVVLWFFLLSNRRSDVAVHDLYFDARQIVIVGYTLVAFGCLVWAVDAGLLGDPAMDIVGPSCSSGAVQFFVDRTADALPVSTVVSLPLWVYRVIMFVWALWLAISLLRWAKWGWESFKAGGLFRLPSDTPTPPATPPQR
ncbi:MAG: hypothetical protein U0353_16085 [Sandaracinus sp.]